MGAVDAVAISPDGGLLALGGVRGGVRLLDLETGERRKGPPPVDGNVYSLAFSPRDRALAIASDRALVVWGPEADRARFTATHPTPWYCPRIAFRPDGRLLVAVAPEVGDVRGWDPDTGAEVPVPVHKEPARALAFSPDGSLLALARGKDIEVWETGGWRRRLAAHTQTVEALAFAADGRLASGGGDRAIRLWDAAQGRELLVLRGHTADVTCLGFTADGRRLVSGDMSQFVKVWDVTHPPEGRAFPVADIGLLGEWVANLVFGPDGQTLHILDLDRARLRSRVRRWDVDEGRLVAENPLFAAGARPQAVLYYASLSADGRWVAASTPEEPGTLRVGDTDGAEGVGTIRTGAARARPLAPTADGRRLAYLAWGAGVDDEGPRVELGVAERTGTIRARVELPPGRIVVDACFSPDGRLLVAPQGTVVRGVSP